MPVPVWGEVIGGGMVIESIMRFLRRTWLQMIIPPWQEVYPGQPHRKTSSHGLY
jgi:hypothetical protein